MCSLFITSRWDIAVWGVERSEDDPLATLGL
jgi:hypothetical protein